MTPQNAAVLIVLGFAASVGAAFGTATAVSNAYQRKGRPTSERQDVVVWLAALLFAPLNIAFWTARGFVFVGRGLWGGVHEWKQTLLVKPKPLHAVCDEFEEAATREVNAIAPEGA